MKEYETKVMFTPRIFWDLFRETGIMKPLYNLIATDGEKKMKLEECEKDIRTINTIKIVMVCLTAGMIPVANNVSSRIFISVGAVIFWIVFSLVNHYTNIKALGSFEAKLRTFFVYFCSGSIEYSIICQPIEQIEKVLLEKALLIKDPSSLGEMGEKRIAEIRLAEAVDHALTLGYMKGDSSRAYKRIWDELVPEAKRSSKEKV